MTSTIKRPCRAISIKKANGTSRAETSWKVPLEPKRHQKGRLAATATAAAAAATPTLRLSTNPQWDGPLALSWRTPTYDGDMIQRRSSSGIVLALSQWYSPVALLQWYGPAALPKGMVPQRCGRAVDSNSIIYHLI